MPSVLDFPVRGKVLSTDNGTLVFAPANSNNYQFKLATSGSYTGPLNEPVDGRVRVKARKVYTMATGGTFVAPIVGPPKIIQGRVRFVDDRQLVLHVGVAIVVDLPTADDAIDLANGPIAVGSLVNVVALPGATFEVLSPKS